MAVLYKFYDENYYFRVSFHFIKLHWQSRTVQKTNWPPLFMFHINSHLDFIRILANTFMPESDYLDFYYFQSYRYFSAFHYMSSKLSVPADCKFSRYHLLFRINYERGLLLVYKSYPAAKRIYSLLWLN